MLINHPKERIQRSQQRESLKRRIIHLYGEETAQYIQLLKKLQIKKSKIKKNILLDSQFHNYENNEGLNYKNSSLSRMT
jgi:transcription elongation factor GreA-like protein